MKYKKCLYALIPVVALFTFGALFASRSNWYRRDHTTASGQIYLLEIDGTTTQQGAHKFGDDEDSPTLPTTTTADDFSMKLPFYNASGSVLSKGMVIVSSVSINNASTIAYGTITTLTSTTTVLGVCDGTVAIGAKGWMSVGGYATVLTTGTIPMGSLIVSSGSTVAGYAGAITPGATVEAGAVIGKAVSTTAATGGSIIVRLGF